MSTIYERMAAWRAWEQRKEQLDVVLTDDEWARLRLDLRYECANHEKDTPLYRYAQDCPHDIPLDDYDYTDEMHVQDEEGELLCLAEVVGHACICQDGYCSQTASAETAREELWIAVRPLMDRTY